MNLIYLVKITRKISNLSNVNVHDWIAQLICNNNNKNVDVSKKKRTKYNNVAIVIVKVHPDNYCL